MLSTKVKVLVIAGSLLLAFAGGRYSATITSKFTETVKTDTKIKDDKAIDTKTTTVTVKQPNGAETTTTTSETKTVDKLTENQDQTTNIQKTTTSGGSKINISIIGAEDFTRGLAGPTYGLSVSKEILGPITIGAFGLRSGVIGLSIGVNF